MGNKTVNDLTALTGVASGDYALLWDVSASGTRKATITNILAVLLAQANTFTATQTVTPTTTTNGVVINMPASTTTGVPIVTQVNGVNAARFIATDSTTNLIVDARDLGNNVRGPTLTASRNTNGGAAGPAPGLLNLFRANGNPTFLWFDNSALLRLNSAAPTGSTGTPTVDITAGTVVGTQTSSLDTKNILGEVGSPEEALRAIVEAAKTLRRFTYKNESFGGEEFEGVVTDFAPRYGMDRDAAHPAGKSLNEIQLFGDLIRAVALLAQKVGLA